MDGLPIHRDTSNIPKERAVNLTRWAIFLGASVFAAASVPDGSRQSTASTSAVPIPPVRAILDAFRSRSLVALADDHGNEQLHAFRLSLIRDQQFPTVVNDIVVEFGNARYQDVMDRFVRGNDVPYETLRHVWQDTTQQNAVWDRPIYEEFFRAVRTVNASLPQGRQIRVLLGDPPVDWSAGGGDAGRWTPQRDQHDADVIAREVVAPRRHALIVYGGGHLFRAGQSLVNRVEQATGTQVFTITVAGQTTFDLVQSLQPDVASWPIPSMVVLRNTRLQQRELVYYDGLLYLGPPSTMSFSRLSAALCSDKDYVQMRTTRLAALGQRAIDDFRAECGLAR